MDAFLTDQSSCAVLRVSRYSEVPRLGESKLRTVSIDPGSRVQWWRRAVEEVSQLVEVDSRHPLCVLVPDRNERVRSPLVSSTVCSAILPKGSFLTAEFGEGDAFLAIESSAHSFASLARALDQAQRAKRLTHLQARALLLAYGYELCGSYARDARSPLTGECHYRLEPVASPEELSAWCLARGGRNVRGSRLARDCAPQVMAGSASPAETIHGIVFTSPPELGGLGMSDVLMNHSLDLSPEERLLVHRLPLTPDLTFPQLGGRVLEHQGNGHDAPRKYQEDASRSQDYAALGRRMMMTSAVDLVTPQRYDAFLRRFFAWVRHDLGASAAQPYQEVLDDPACTTARHELVSALTDRVHDPWSW